MRSALVLAALGGLSVAAAVPGNPTYHPTHPKCYCKPVICPYIVPGYDECVFRAKYNCWKANHWCPKPVTYGGHSWAQAVAIAEASASGGNAHAAAGASATASGSNASAQAAAAAKANGNNASAQAAAAAKANGNNASAQAAAAAQASGKHASASAQASASASSHRRERREAEPMTYKCNCKPRENCSKYHKKDDYNRCLWRNDYFCWKKDQKHCHKPSAPKGQSFASASAQAEAFASGGNASASASASAQAKGGNAKASAQASASATSHRRERRDAEPSNNKCVCKPRENCKKYHKKDDYNRCLWRNDYFCWKKDQKHCHKPSAPKGQSFASASAQAEAFASGGNASASASASASANSH